MSIGLPRQASDYNFHHGPYVQGHVLFQSFYFMVWDGVWRKAAPTVRQHLQLVNAWKQKEQFKKSTSYEHEINCYEHEINCYEHEIN